MISNLRGWQFHTQALIEKCIVRPSNRKEFPLLSTAGGWLAAADLALDPARDQL